VPDLGLSCTVSRTLLSLAPLDCNDGVTYRLTAESFSSRQMSWQREEASSPFLDGAVTVYRTRQKVTDQVGFEVLGDTPALVQQHVNELKRAFAQSRFTLGLQIDGAAYQFDCEAADYAEAWSGPRWVARQLQVLFSVPNSPVPIAGGEY